MLFTKYRVFPSGGPNSDADRLTSSVIKNKDLLYRLIISQLFYDGYQQVAVQLSNMLQIDPACPPSERLFNVVRLGLELETDTKAAVASAAVPEIVGPGLDLEFETDVEPSAAEPALYETAYVTSHKGNCRAGAFSADGMLCATGSTDASIKVLDVERMLAKSNMDAPGKNTEQGHPVIRTLYDHIDVRLILNCFKIKVAKLVFSFQEVTCLDFHPKEAVLASGSRDCTVKLFDYSKASAKKAMRTITDAEQISTISFHPTGDYLLVGCEQPIIRMYDVNTCQCFVGMVPSQQHKDIIT